MTTLLIAINAVLATLVFVAMLTLVGSGIRSDRRFALTMHRRRHEASVLALAEPETETETAWRKAA